MRQSALLSVDGHKWVAKHVKAGGGMREQCAFFADMQRWPLAAELGVYRARLLPQFSVALSNKEFLAFAYIPSSGTVTRDGAALLRKWVQAMHSAGW
jgi:hypothetical protein